MKKALSILLASAMVFGLTACGGSTPAPAPEPAPAAEAPAPAAEAPAPAAEAPAPAASNGPIRVGYAQLGAESDWRVANTKSIQDACAAAGIELTFVDCQQQQARQIQALRDFITQGVDVIGFSPVVESGWDDVIAEINAAGIPLIYISIAFYPHIAHRM